MKLSFLKKAISNHIVMLLAWDKYRRSVEQIRKGWDKAFEKMAQENDDQLIDKEEVEVPSEWDKTEWTW